MTSIQASADHLSLFNRPKMPIQQNESGLYVAQAAKPLNDSVFEAQSKGSSKKTESLLGEKGIADNFDMFIKLLMTSMKNQDPMNPADTTQVTQQIATFAGVGEQMKANKELRHIAELLQQRSIGVAQGFLGVEVEAKGDLITVREPGQPVSFSYALPDGTTAASVVISDAQSNVVGTQQLNTSPGKHTAEWVAKDLMGQDLPEGVYRIQVMAKNQQGKPFLPETFVRGYVTGFEQNGGEIFLSLDRTAIPMGNVVATVAPDRPPTHNELKNLLTDVVAKRMGIHGDLSNKSAMDTIMAPIANKGLTKEAIQHAINNSTILNGLDLAL